MSTRYKMVCIDCKEYIEAADRSFRGCALTPISKKLLAFFIVAHSNHNIKVISEYDELFDSSRYNKWTKEKLREIE